MKLDILCREITDITITDEEVLISMQLSMSHGAVRKVVTSITIEHAVSMSPKAHGVDEITVEDAINIAVAGIRMRGEDTVVALRGLSSL